MSVDDRVDMPIVDEEIRRLTECVKQISHAGILDGVPIIGNNELAELCCAINQLMAEYKKSSNEKGKPKSNNVNTNEQTNRLREALSLLQDVDNKYYQSDSENDYFRQVLEIISEVMKIKYGALGVYDKNNQLKEFVTVGIDEQAKHDIGQIPQGKGLLSVLLNGNKTFRSNNIQAEQESVGVPSGHPELKTLLSTPVILDGEVKGIIYLSEKNCGSNFTDIDQYMLEIVADQVAQEIGRNELMSIVTEANRRLQIEQGEHKALIDQLTEAQNQLLQSEKMASIGLLAAGVAHEINNPVGYINSNISSLEKYLKDIFLVLDAYEAAESNLADDALLAQIRSLKEKIDLSFLKEDIVQLVKESKEGINRVKNIVQGLKDFSHVDDMQWQWANLHNGIDSTLNVVHNEIKYKAAVIKEYGDIPEVECLPSQINQVFMNLLVNAAYAIEERGTITVRSGVNGNMVWVEVADTGKGIEPENIPKLFNAFFTTKPVGKGTGLGLSLAFGIIEKHNGSIEVDSAVGKGTRFTVRLPIEQPEKNTADVTVSDKE